MVSFNSISPTRIFSAITERMTPQRLTVLFGVVVAGMIGTYVYRRLYPSLVEQGRQALVKKDDAAFERIREEAYEKRDHQTLHALGVLALEKEYPKAFLCFDNELNTTPADYMAPYFWRNLADLKIGEFHRAIDSSERAFKDKNLDKRIVAQLHLQRAQANIGLHKLETVRASIDEAINLYPATSRFSFQAFKGWLPIFRENAKYFPTQSRFLAQAEYLKAVVSFMEGNLEEVVQTCDRALTHLSDQDLAFKMEILALKALAYYEREDYEQSLDVATVALRLKEFGKASTETLVTLHFCLAVSHSQYMEALQSFCDAISHIQNDSLLCGYISLQKGCFFKASAEILNSAQALANQEFDLADYSCLEDNPKPWKEPLRCNQLVRCILWPLLKDLKDGESPVTRLQAKIREERPAAI